MNHSERPKSDEVSVSEYVSQVYDAPDLVGRSVDGGAPPGVAVTCADCGSQHSMITDLQPTTIKTGSTTAPTGTGNCDELGCAAVPPLIEVKLSERPKSEEASVLEHVSQVHDTPDLVGRSVDGGAPPGVAVTWADCGSRHSKITDLQPTTSKTGSTTTLTGTDDCDEEVTSATYASQALGTTADVPDASSDMCSMCRGTGITIFGSCTLCGAAARRADEACRPTGSLGQIGTLFDSRGSLARIASEVLEKLCPPGRDEGSIDTEL